MDTMENYGNSSCTMLLLCKLKPFITKMQSELMKKDRQHATIDDELSLTGIVMKKLPRIEDFNSNGIECERKYEKCKIF